MIGQEWAKKVLSVAVYNHYKRIFNNLSTSSQKKGSEEQEQPATANQGGRGRTPQAWAGTFYSRSNEKQNDMMRNFIQTLLQQICFK